MNSIGAEDPYRISIGLTRDSVCMADDVDAPHARTFEVDPQIDIQGVADIIARSAYLPMPSDAWGWTIQAEGVVVAIRPSPVLGRWVEILQGDPTQVRAGDITSLAALYVRPASPWRDVGTSCRRIEVWQWYIALSVLALIAFACW